MIDTTPFVQTLSGKPIAVYGLGVSGLSCARTLRQAGAALSVWDSNEDKRALAQAEGFPLKDFETEGMDGFAVLVLSPGIPLYFPAPHPVVERARAAGAEILCDIEIMARCLNGQKTIGITGTNGKSTTTALIYHILKESGISAVMGGNIGKPVLDMDLPDAPSGVVVLELSSYQLDLCPVFRPDVSILLNITPDHLDRHGDIQGYAHAKARIFENQGVAIIGCEEDITRSIAADVAQQNERDSHIISIHHPVSSGVYFEGGTLVDAMNVEDVLRFDSMSPLTKLPGDHNKQNICAAYAACRALGMAGEDICAQIKTYPGLAHRQFLTRIINGVAYINDSKATNADAASKAIACYKNIYLIAGGLPKTGGLKGLEPLISHLSHVYLIGQAQDEFAVWLSNMHVPHTKCDVMEAAVAQAHKEAQRDRGNPLAVPTVLLSPACASWDQYKSFEHRGDSFMQIVNTLPEEGEA